MKTNDKKDLQTKTKEDLVTKLKDLRKEVFELTMEHTLGKLTNTRLLFHKRREIAVIMTILKEKEAQAHAQVVNR